MKLSTDKWIRAASWLGGCLAWIFLNAGAASPGFTTTTVHGTVYLAGGQPASGTLQLSWPAFTTANNQAVAAGRSNVSIGADGYVSVNLAPNQGSTPAGLYYTAVYHLNDGTTSTEYWIIPAAGQASLSQVRAQVMPAAQAVQAVSKGYVDQSIAELTQSLLTASGGSLSGPLFLNGDPTQPTQAATKHYVDGEFSMAVPLTGGVVSGPLTSLQLGAAYQVDQFPGADFGTRLQACLSRLDAVYGGTCDARNFTGNQAIGSTVTISTANATVQLPCATIATANQIQITAGTRNVTLHGCGLRGASNASGSQGGTVFLYSGSRPMIQVGDTAYASNTLGFHLDNVVINTTASADAGAQGLTAYRTQELDLQSIYFLGNSNQTGMTLDGTGNYTGGTFQDLEFGGFGTAVSGIGHQVTNSSSTDWLNASTFVRLHINCPTSGGSPVSGTYGINLLQGDGNTFTGGDVEGCATALHLGTNAQNNTIIGLRNENSISQVVADEGSAYNNWITGGTMFTGKLTDNGTRNSFLDTFHRSFNSLNGDWYGSQQDATVTNHFRLGTGAGNERGLLNRFQSDYGYRWTTGLSDATAGEQFYQVLDDLNNVYRLSIGQYNHGQSSTNNQTVINAAGTGAVVLNGSANSGTGGVIFGAGGSTGAAVATINSAGNAQFNGSLQVGGPSTFISTTTVKNQADAEIDSVLWAGTTANQKEWFIYKDYTGASQWYMVKDASNNWALNSAIGGLDSFKAYQSNNSGDTYINASNGTGHIRLNYETGSGNETDIYSGSSSGLVAAFLGSTAIKFPGLAASSGHNCLQIDNSGYISSTGVACGTGSGINGTVNAGSAGQLAYYAGNGTVIAGMNSVAIASGGTGATTAAQALQNLGAQPTMPGVASDGASGLTIGGAVAALASMPANHPVIDLSNFAYGLVVDGTTDNTSKIQAGLNACPHTTATGGNSCQVIWPMGGAGVYVANASSFTVPSGVSEQWVFQGGGGGGFAGPGLRLGSTFVVPSNVSIVSAGGGLGAQYGIGGAKATITAPHVAGTLGTAITATNTPVIISPTLTMGSTLPPAGAAITMSRQITCTASASRAATGVVTLTYASACRIASLNVVNVTGCSDSSINATGALLYNADNFSALAAQFKTATLSSGSATGCSVTGNDDSGLTTSRVLCSNGTALSGYGPCSAGQIQLVAAQTYASTDIWGEVAVAPPLNASNIGMHGIAVTGCVGPCLFLEHASSYLFENDDFESDQPLVTGYPAELASSLKGTFTNVTFKADYTNTCTTGCGKQNVIAVRSTFEPTYFNPARDTTNADFVTIRGGFINGEIKVDSNGQSNGVATGAPRLVDVTIEGPPQFGVRIDSRSFVHIADEMFQNTWIQDALPGINASLVGCSDPGNSNAFSLSILNYSGTAPGGYVDNVCNARVFADNADENATLPAGNGSPSGAYVGNGHLQAEMIGPGFNYSPSLIPFPTQAVTAPGSMSASFGTITTGIQGPDLTTNAFELDTTNSSNSAQAAYASYSGATAIGHWFFFGGCAAPGLNQTRISTAHGNGGVFGITTFGTDSFGLPNGYVNPYNNTDSGSFQLAMHSDLWCEPVVADAYIAAGEATPHTVTAYVYGGPPDPSMSYGNQFFDPFLIYSTEVLTAAQAEHIRQNLLHGYVPSGSAGGVLAVDPNLPIALPAGSTAPTQTAGDSSTDVATDAFVGTAVANAIAAVGLPSTPAGCLSGSYQYPCVVASVNQTGLTANIGSYPTAYTVPSNGAGWYEIECYESETRAATTSSTLPECDVAFTDEDSNANGLNGTNNIWVVGRNSGNTSNTVGTTNLNTGGSNLLTMRVAAGGAIQYWTGNYYSYASSGATSMAYGFHLKIKYLGP